MNRRIKVVQIPNTATAAQMETALNNQTTKGWKLVQIFTLSTNTYAILEKVVAM